ncbi:MAG: hypothetical protein D6785_07920 [Planctomycetota bacterium]|nr:MAG: hypothetical protein D6785_07920 [Planctomycetota bacterium]
MKKKGLDRRWIYLIMGIVTVAFLLIPFPLPPGGSIQSKALFEKIDSLKPGDTVFLAVDYDPPAGAEIYPAHVAIVYHLFKKRVKMIAGSLWPAGPPLSDKAFADAIKLLEKEGFPYKPKYGVDYCNLGYKPGREIAIVNMGSSLPKTFPKDSHEYSTSDYEHLPIMKGVQNFSQIKLVISFSAGNPGTREWIAQARDRFNIEIVGAVTAVMSPDLYAFFPRQIGGFAGGLAGAYEYRYMVYEKYFKSQGKSPTSDDVPFPGKELNRSMAVQSIVHFLIIFLVILGNISFFLSRKKT